MATQGWVSPATAWLTVALDFSATLLPTPASPPAPPFRMRPAFFRRMHAGLLLHARPAGGRVRAGGHRGLGCRLFGRWPVRRRAHVRGTGADRCVFDPGSGDLSAGCTQSTDCMAGLLCLSGICTKAALLQPWSGAGCDPTEAATPTVLFHVPRASDPPSSDFYQLPFPTTFVARTARST